MQSLIADEDSILALGLVAGWQNDHHCILGWVHSISRRGDARPVRVIDHQPDWVQALGISPDGKWLAAGRFNGTLSLYDVQNYTEVRGQMMAFERSPATRWERQKAGCEQ